MAINTATKSYKNPKFILFGNNDEGRKIIDTAKKWKMNTTFSKWEDKSGSFTYKKSEKKHFLKRICYRIKYRYFMLYWRLRYA